MLGKLINEEKIPPPPPRFDRCMRTLLLVKFLFQNNNINNTTISQVPWYFIKRRLCFVATRSNYSVKEVKEVSKFKRKTLTLTHTDMFSRDSNDF